jgi:hypothetical protein
VAFLSKVSPQIYVAVLERESFTSRLIGPPKNWRVPFPQEFELRTFSFFLICFPILLLLIKLFSVDENEDEETRRVDVAKRQKFNGLMKKMSIMCFLLQPMVTR